MDGSKQIFNPCLNLKTLLHLDLKLPCYIWRSVISKFGGNDRECLALMEWRKPDVMVVEQFKNLAERLQHPRVLAARMAGHRDRYKIKLRSVGYGLVYEVQGAVLLVIMVAVGKRERNAVYRVAAKR